MKTPLNVHEEDRFRERTGIRSGPIERVGFSPRGVIFTYVSNPREELKAKYTPEVLLNAQIENLDLPAREKDRFFTVLGGYYMQRSRNADGDLVVRVSRVFGICQDQGEGFDIPEGGDKILADNWKLSSVPDVRGGNPVKDMDERIHRKDDDGEQVGKQEEEGWTLIVEAKARRGLYPKSGGPMGLQVECPGIISFDSRQENKGKTSLTVRFEVITKGISPEKYVWRFGDGTAGVETVASSIEHTYDSRKGEDVTYEADVTVIGPGECSLSDKTLVVVERRIDEPLPCPGIERITVTKRPSSDDRQSVKFTAEVTGTSPTRYLWDFGDGSASVTTMRPIVEHIYEQISREPRTFNARVQAFGPGDCEASAAAEFSIEPSGKSKRRKAPECTCFRRCVCMWRWMRVRRILARRCLWRAYVGCYPVRIRRCGCRLLYPPLCPCCCAHQCWKTSGDKDVH